MKRNDDPVGKTNKRTRVRPYNNVHKKNDVRINEKKSTIGPIRENISTKTYGMTEIITLCAEWSREYERNQRERIEE